MNKADAKIVRGFFHGLKPEPIMLVSDWADKHRKLSKTASSEHGPWRTSRTPYLKKIMDKLSAHDPCEKIVFMKGHQIGGTEAGMNWIGYIMDNSPSATMMVMPTVETMKRNSKIRVAPMIEATPRLRNKVLPEKSRGGDNTIFQKSFPGGVLILSGANSSASLRSLPMRNLMLDEIDEYPDDLEGQGDPIELVMKRSSTYPKKKAFLVSTPTIEGSSKIEAEFEATDMQKYFVPCPHCDHYQILEFENLSWEKGNWDTAVYGCEECGGVIEEYQKTKMLARGEWRPTKPELSSKKRIGFHLSSLYSPPGWYSWSKTAEDWEKAQGDVNKLKTFINTVLGETWVEKGEAPEWETLYDRRIPYEVNKPKKEVVMITAGADVQKDRIEVEIVGWCRDKITYSIDYRVIPGDTTKKETWDHLSRILGEEFEREDGLLMPILMMGVDSGYNTQYVYDFVRRSPEGKTFSIKGSDSQATIIGTAKSVDVTIDGVQVGRSTLYNVGVSVLKAELYGFLKQKIGEEGEIPPGYCFFPEYDRDYFKGITAERLTYKTVRGFKKYEWTKHRERNEPLDCRVYARAAAALLGMDRFKPEHWKTIEESYGRLRKERKKKRKRRDNDFW